MLLVRRAAKMALRFSPWLHNIFTPITNAMQLLQRSDFDMEAVTEIAESW
jgi:hypothetical protein